MSTEELYGREFFNEMQAGRELSRRLAECIHAVIGSPQDAIDLGAGLGLQTGRLRELGWEISGGDFAPLAIEMREPGVEVSAFDLTQPGGGGTPKSPVSCVICTEVAEHISGEFADTIVSNVVALARKFIVWSAAPPGQGGTGHINCQPPAYWLNRFKTAGWIVSGERTERLRTMMRESQAQHWHYAANFFVLLPGDHTVDTRPLHMTITSTVLNGEQWIGKHLSSVASQTFRNFSHVVIDAKSEDDTVWRAQNHVISDGHLTLIENDTRLSALENCWRVWKDLPPDEVIVWLDGDDWLAHDQALEVVAKAYLSPQKETWLTFGQFMFADGAVGFAAPYPPGAHPRYMDWRATHLKTFRAGLVQQLSVEDFMNQGKYVELAIDKAIMWPLLELAGDRYTCIHQVLSVYNLDASWAAGRSPAELQVELNEVERLRRLPQKHPLTKRPW
jgi:hypothetical protein